MGFNFLESFKKNFIGGVEEINALPNTDHLNKAYILTLKIEKEDSPFSKDNLNNMINTGITTIHAYCPEKLDLNFSNNWDSVDPMAVAGSTLMNGGFQLFTGRSTVHRINKIWVWKGSEPLQLTIKFQLYALSNDYVESAQSRNSAGISKMTPVKLLKVLQTLSSLAQPKEGEMGFLIPPGPSPLIVRANVKVQEVKEKIENGKVVDYELTVKRDASLNEITKKYQSKGGTSCELQFGDFFKMSHILVKSVNISIPYVMAGSENNLNEAKSKLQSAINNKVDEDLQLNKLFLNKETAQKELDQAVKNNRLYRENPLKELNSSLGKANSDLKTENNSINSKVEEINKKLNSLSSQKARNSSNEKQRLEEEKEKLLKKQSTNNKTISDNIKAYNKKEKDTRGYEETKKAKERALKSAQKEYDEASALAQKRSESGTDNNGKAYPEKEELNDIIKYTNGNRALPIMAEVTMNVQTKTIVTQEMFEKMILNEPQSNPAVVDLTKMTGIIADALNEAVSASLAASDNLDIYYNGKLISKKEYDNLKNSLKAENQTQNTSSSNGSNGEGALGMMTDEERKAFASMTPSQQQEVVKKNMYNWNEGLKNKK